MCAFPRINQNAPAGHPIQPETGAQRLGPACAYQSGDAEDFALAQS